jgi:hypothetical protein
MIYQYQIIKDEFNAEVIKRADSEGKVLWIPTDPENSDYAEYLASLEATEPEAE